MSIIKSYFPYTGNKSKLIPQLQELFPPKVRKFVDLFAGTGTVGINYKNCDELHINDISTHLLYLNAFLYQVSQNESVDDFLEVFKSVFERYATDGSILEEDYYRLREDYNKDYSPMKLLLLSMFSINHLFRFNKKNKFNASYGGKQYKIFEKEMLRVKNITDFIEGFKGRNVIFTSMDFESFNFSELTNEDYVFIDPPYFNSSAQYNITWNEDKEKSMYKLLDDLNEKGVMFGITNTLINKGEKNPFLDEWCEKYNIHLLKKEYNTWSNCRTNLNTETKEIFVTNVGG